jgi:hypothetical protein
MVDSPFTKFAPKNTPSWLEESNRKIQAHNISVRPPLEAVDASAITSDYQVSGKENKSKFNADQKIRSPNRVTNPLHAYSSFNSIFTLAVLTPEEVNFPAVLRTRLPQNIILRSGGSGASKVPTEYDKNFNTGKEGKAIREFFISQVVVEQSMGISDNKQSNVNTTEFIVHEYYSMGLFIDTLRQAAKQAGLKNYLKAPYVLMIDFIGTDEKGNIKQITDGDNVTIRRIYPISINSVDFSADQSGAQYRVRASAYNEVALSATSQQLEVDVTLKGNTVQDLLQKSLQKAMDEKRKSKTPRAPVPNEIVINFPKAAEVIERANRKSFNNDENDRATQKQFGAQTQKTILIGSTTPVNSMKNGGISFQQDAGSLNDIGKAKINLTEEQRQRVSSNTLNVYDRVKKIGKFVNFPQGEATFLFTATKTIEDVITCVILFSDYAKNLLGDSDVNGMRKWFKIIPRKYIIIDEEYLNDNGNYPYLLVFDVVENLVHEHVFLPANTKPQTLNIENLIVKEYDYLYTGKNLDVLSFDIQVNAQYAQTIASDAARGKDNLNRKVKAEQQSKSSIDNSEENKAADQAVGTGENKSSIYHSRAWQERIESVGELTDEQKIALEYHDKLMTSQVMLAKAEITILGDPYYLCDSGLGNYYARRVIDSVDGKTKLFINADGSMDDTQGIPMVAVNFRTPLDSDEFQKGIIVNEGAKVFKKLPDFSGVFSVNKITSTFEAGLFKQTLTLARVANQEIEAAEKVGKNKKNLYELGLGSAVGTNIPDDASA